MNRMWMAGIWLAAATAASIEDTARELSDRYADAVVAVTGVLRVEVPGSGGSRAQEYPLETFGTVVGTDGLTAVSASALDPLGGVGPIDVNVGGQSQSVRPRSSTSQIKIRRADGVEVTARQVLKDEDLDIAFLLPEPEKGKKAPTFDVSVSFKDDVQARPLDEIIGVGRMGKLFNWAPAVGLSRVISRIDKPRTMYLFSAGFTGGVGTPIFTADGRPLGLVVVRRQPGSGGSGRAPSLNQAAVILPAVEIADLIEQAKAAAAKRNSES